MGKRKESVFFSCAGYSLTLMMESMFLQNITSFYPTTKCHILFMVSAVRTSDGMQHCSLAEVGGAVDSIFRLV